MPQLLAVAAPPTFIPELPRKKWSREEVCVLESTGLLDGQHLELIEGELFNKMGKGWLHVSAVHKVFLMLMQLFGNSFVVAEAPIDLAPEDNSSNEPEPDAIVLNRPISEFGPRLPQPADVALVVEVAISSLFQDRVVKSRLYARAGIPEYWIVDLNARQVLVMRQPQGDQYQSCVAYSAGESVRPLGKPDADIPVASLLP